MPLISPLPPPPPPDSATALIQLLNSFREDAASQREKGRYFEDLALVYFRCDATQRNYYGDVQRYAEWARERGRDQSDIGIDLVAAMRGEDGYCAIQAKFHEPGRPLRKPDIDSFIAASDGPEFTRRAIIDTSARDLGAKLRAQIGTLGKPFSRVRLADLERSSIDWASIPTAGEIRDRDAAQRKRKRPMPHQREAALAVREGFRNADRGQVVMACGTGKTYTAQLIAEDMRCRLTLVLVPSLALVSQTVAEWRRDARRPLRAIAVCSDAAVGRRRAGDDDSIRYDIHDLAFPATTDPARLAEQVRAPRDAETTVVFSTYHSIDVVATAQARHGMAGFDLAVCDEAHRTTGQIEADGEGSHFVRVHDAGYLRARKRLYMTATPRIYTDAARSKAQESATTLCAMDDEEMFGKVLFYRGFEWAIRNRLLSDYRVVVLALDETEVSAAAQNALASDNEIRLDDAVKILGSYKALMKHSIDPDDFADDPAPARRAMAFSNAIRESKRIQEGFQRVVDDYLDERGDAGAPGWRCAVRHVDGSFGATEREEQLRWLRAPDEARETCRVLSNVRCLGEGVDVPALDAVLFLRPRKSQIDVVQAVGRVMRRAPGKKRGYIVLPIGVPAGVPPEKALDDNEKYRVIWQIVNALKSHDERLDARINAAGLGEADALREQVQVVLGNLAETAPATLAARRGPGSGEPPADEVHDGAAPAYGQTGIQFQRGIAEAIYARVVRRCGAADYWEDWAEDVQRIAQRHIARIEAAIGDPDRPECRAVFGRFLAELRDDLNPAISEAQAVEMLAQHIITRPVFDAVFAGHDFARQNSVSQAMQSVVHRLDAENIGSESADLARFYESVRRRAGAVATSAGKQELIRRLYESFFRKSFGRIAEQLGIVYTPVAVVDYILHAVNGVMQEAFGFGLGQRDVKILDPFAGTGTFIVRALESGLIAPEDLRHKYREDLHASEIVPLAYYVACINIENAYHARIKAAGGERDGEYEPFDGLCLTDTFQSSEHQGALSGLFPQNQRRIDRQRKLDFLAIVGNPPYSVGQRSANDNAANVAYPHLDERIAQTYARRSTRQLRRNLYDSYIRAIRWASDRIGDRGVIGFVTNGGWLDASAMDGLRHCLREEFGSLYVLNMRGDQRTAGELSRREGGKLFGAGSRAPIVISVFVKNPDKAERGAIHYHDIGDYLSREEKLSRLEAFSQGSKRVEWCRIEPDAYGDWIRQRDAAFDSFVALGDKSRKSTATATVFRLYSMGLATSRDAWCYNASHAELQRNVRNSLNFFNEEVNRYAASDRSIPAKDFVDTDPTKFSWDRQQRQWAQQGKRIEYLAGSVRASIYRPFSRQYCYFDRSYNNCVYQLPSIFPEANTDNRLICTTSAGDKAFSTLMVDRLPDLHLIGAAQCFPRYAYFQTVDGTYEQQSNINEAVVRSFQTAYPDRADAIDANAVFHYIYGLLHSPDYRHRFGVNLLKQLPRIPHVADSAAFFAFSQAGRKLGDLHIHYEDADLWLGARINGQPLAQTNLDPAVCRVEKMRFAGTRGSDRTRVIYNRHITVSEIPDAAFEYTVNGKSPVEWVIERQRVTIHKASGIENDANRYATETLNDPAYPLKLLLRAITIGIESARLIRELPPLKLLKSPPPPFGASSWSL